jgi:hypothetical protein
MPAGGTSVVTEVTRSATPAGSVGPVRCPSDARKDGFCHDANDSVNRCTGLVKGCSGTVRPIGGNARHSTRDTDSVAGDRADVSFRRHGHIALTSPV